jgi:hypothetical protein
MENGHFFAERTKESATSVVSRTSSLIYNTAGQFLLHICLLQNIWAINGIILLRVSKWLNHHHSFIKGDKNILKM